MFVFYFGILADDTPPVGLAAFAAAAISGGDPIKTGVIGFSYDIRTAILPFLFIFNTELLLIDVTLGKAVFVFLVSVVAMMLYSAATQNWFLTRSRLWESAVLLLVAFTLFRPGFWLDMITDPYQRAAPSEIAAMANNAEDSASIRVRMSGEDFVTGDIVETTIDLPLGMQADGDGATRLDRHAGLAFRTEDYGRVYVDMLNFGQYAQERGIDFDLEVLFIETEADRMPKEVFYLPAILLLVLVSWLQLRRRPRQAQALS